MKNRKIIIPIVIPIIVIVIYLLINTNKRNPDEISGSGTIEVTEVEIASKISGKVERIECDEGNNVKAGDLLVVLSHNELDAQLNQAKANLESVKAQITQLDLQLQNVKDNLIRAKELFKVGNYTRQQLDKDETQYKVINAQCEAAKQTYAQVEAQINYINAQIENAYLKTPISGIVLQKNVEVGEIVSPGMSILTIGDLKKPWLKIYITEDKLSNVKLNDKAIVKIDSSTGKTYEGKVVYISSKAEFTPKNIQTKEERVKLVYAVKIILDNKNGELKPGMFADGFIYVKDNQFK